PATTRPRSRRCGRRGWCEGRRVVGVGWVERSETHLPPAGRGLPKMGFASLNPSYGLLRHRSVKPAADSADPICPFRDVAGVDLGIWKIFERFQFGPVLIWLHGKINSAPGSR